MKKHLKTLVILLLPIILGATGGKCENILGSFFYIPCDTPSSVNFTGSATKYNDTGTVFISAVGAIYYSYDYCADPMIYTTVPGNPRLNQIVTGHWERYNIIAGNTGTIVRASIEDPVWRTVTSNTTQNLNNVARTPIAGFLDYLIAVGNGGTIIASRNSGRNWYNKNFPYNINLKDIEFKELYDDTLNIRVVGDGLSAYFTTNGGTTWIDDSLNFGLDLTEYGHSPSSGGLNMNTLQFLNDNTGYIAGQNGWLFKTVDGGRFYFLRVIANMDNIVDMHFIAPDSGFVISSNGRMKFTDDGGNTWFEDPQVNSLINNRSLNSISRISNNYGFVNGSNGLLLLAARDSSLIGVSQTSNLVPSGYNLSQNYPNPFNPVTNISFTVPHRDYIKLIVFDLLGSEIETLYNGEIGTGTYNIDWNAESYPSGVYFYRLETESFTQSRKMILVK